MRPTQRNENRPVFDRAKRSGRGSGQPGEFRIAEQPRRAGDSSPGRAALGKKSHNLTSPAGAQENTSYRCETETVMGLRPGPAQACAPPKGMKTGEFRSGPWRNSSPDTWPVTGVPGSALCSRAPLRRAKLSRECKRAVTGRTQPSPWQKSCRSEKWGLPPIRPPSWP